MVGPGGEGCHACRGRCGQQGEGEGKGGEGESAVSVVPVAAAKSVCACDGEAEGYVGSMRRARRTGRSLTRLCV